MIIVPTKLVRNSSAMRISPACLRQAPTSTLLIELGKSGEQLPPHILEN